MQYGFGDCLADTGFNYFEKLHEPIFLIHRLRGVARINESARKLISFSKLSQMKVNELISQHLKDLFAQETAQYKRYRINNSQLFLIIRKLRNSDYLLVEVKRYSASSRPT